MVLACLAFIAIFANGVAAVLTSWSVVPDAPAIPPAQLGGAVRLRRRLVVDWRHLVLGLAQSVAFLAPIMVTAFVVMWDAHDAAERRMLASLGLVVALTAFVVSLLWYRRDR